MVRHQIDEDCLLDRNGIVAAVLVVADSRNPVHTFRTVNGETLDVLTELRAVADEVLGRQSVREFGQRLHCRFPQEPATNSSAGTTYCWAFLFRNLRHLVNCRV